MSAVEECYEVTKQLLALVQKEVGEDEREAIIEKIESLLEKRETLLSHIHPPFTAIEEQMGKQMIEWNREIDKSLKKLQMQIQVDMQGIKKKKTSVQKYVNPYESLQPDGIYYDKRN